MISAEMRPNNQSVKPQSRADREEGQRIYDYYRGIIFAPGHEFPTVSYSSHNRAMERMEAAVLDPKFNGGRFPGY